MTAEQIAWTREKPVVPGHYRWRVARQGHEGQFTEGDAESNGKTVLLGRISYRLEEPYYTNVFTDRYEWQRIEE